MQTTTANPYKRSDAKRSKRAREQTLARRHARRVKYTDATDIESIIFN